MKHKKKEVQQPGFWVAKEKKFIIKLPTQRKNTNKKLADLKAVLNKIEITKYPESIQKEVKVAISNIKQTLSLRNKIDSLDIPAAQAIRAFTSMNAQFLNTIAVIALLPKRWKDFCNFNYFL